MRTPNAAAVMVLTTCCLAACGAGSGGGDIGGSSGGSSMPRTSANVSLCAALARTLDGKSSVQQLAGLVFQSNAPVTRRLREVIGTYAADRATGTQQSAAAAAAKAENACRSIRAPIARRYGGTG